MKRPSFSPSPEFSLFDHFTEGFYAVDENLTYLYINRKAAELAQKEPQEMIGKKITDIFPDAHKLEFGKTLRLVMKEKKAHTIEAYYPKYNKWYEAIMFPISQGVGIVSRDITIRKQLVEDQLRMTAIVSSSEDAIISKNLDSIITSWNHAAEKIFGYKAEEVIGKSIRIIIPKELHQEEDKILAKLRQGKRIEHFETTRVTKAGKRIEVSLTISPLKLPSGKIIGASKIARDITEKKLLEKQKDNFISIASHELKTPLTSIVAFIQILQRKVEDTHDKSLSYIVSKIEGQAEKLHHLIDDLLDIRKIQLGKLELNQKAFPIDDIVRDIVSTFQYSVESHTVMLEGEAKSIVTIDRDRIEQVLTNLITNAMKYSPEKRKVVVKISKKNNEVVIGIKDFGVGIAKKEQTKIFQPFYRANNNIPASGLGLGLHISSDIIKRHGGRMWVESKKGNGSTFYFSLPIAENK